MTTIKARRDDIFNFLKILYMQSNVIGLFNVSPETHDKIIYRLTYLETEKYLFSESRLKKQPESRRPLFRISAITFYINFVSLWLTFLKYSLVALFFHLKLGRDPHRFCQKNRIRYIWLNSAGGVNRFKFAIPDMIESEDSLMYYFFTSNVRQIFQRYKKDRTMWFARFRVPDKKSLQGAIKFLFASGRVFISQLIMRFDNLPLLTRIKLATKISRYLYALVYYHNWAEKMADDLTTRYPDAIFIFDIDEEGKELMLADALNRLKKKTLVIQHGILTNPKEYIPTCCAMACASEREKAALIAEGVENDRLFVIGQSFQTIKDSLYEGENQTVLYPVLVLAAGGPIWMQQKYIRILKNSESLAKFKTTYQRLDPRSGYKTKRRWTYASNVKFTSPTETLGKCVARSKIIISFSISATIVSIRQNRPTIFCMPAELFVPEWHNFMLSLPFVKVVKTSMLLDEALMDTEFKHRGWNFLSEERWRYVDYAFGDLNTKDNLKSLLCKLSTEPVSHRSKTLNQI